MGFLRNIVSGWLNTGQPKAADVAFDLADWNRIGRAKAQAVCADLQAIIDHVGPGFVNFVLANNGTPRPEVLAQYAKVHAYPVRIDRAKVNDLGAVLIEADLLGIEKGAAQDNDVLANEIVQIHNLLKANIPPDALESYLRRSH